MTTPLGGSIGSIPIQSNPGSNEQWGEFSLPPSPPQDTLSPSRTCFESISDAFYSILQFIKEKLLSCFFSSNEEIDETSTFSALEQEEIETSEEIDEQLAPSPSDKANKKLISEWAVALANRENPEFPLHDETDQAVLLSAFHHLVELGMSDAVKYMIDNKEIDPSDRKNKALKIAVENNDSEVVKVLLKDNRVDLSYDKNKLFIRACEKGNDKIVNALSKKVDPSFPYNIGILSAAKKKHFRIVLKLLDNQKVREEIKNNVFLTFACKLDSLEIVQKLKQWNLIFPMSSDEYDDLQQIATDGDIKNILRLIPIKEDEQDSSSVDESGTETSDEFDGSSSDFTEDSTVSSSDTDLSGTSTEENADTSEESD